MNQVVAIVPARGGSKGIPRKNVRSVAGEPLLAYTLRQALEARRVDRVVVSTDDREIARLASSLGVEVMIRPPELSGDAASSESALRHVLDGLAGQDKSDPDLVVFLQATSPLRQPGDIDSAIEVLEAEEADSLFSASTINGFVWRMTEHGPSAFSYDQSARPRRQDAPEDLLENGSIYVFKPWVLREYGNRLGGKVAVYRMHPLDSFQLDEPDDLVLLESLVPLRLGRRTRSDAGLSAAADSRVLSNLRLLVLDFDGVLTDNRVLVAEDGTEAVWCHRGDGWGIARLLDAGLEVLILSAETNAVVAARAAKLQVACVHGVSDKLATLKREAAERGLDASQVAYVGNDVNDLTCMRWAGMPIAVADAEPSVRDAASWVTTRCGGYGAVREIAESLLKGRKDHG